MKTDRPSEFFVEDLTLGPFAHGFGTTDDGRAFTFRTVRSTLVVEIYRPGLDATAAGPQPDDVVALAESRVTEVDLHDARSVTALVRDLVATAVPVVPDSATATRARPVATAADRR